MSDIETGGPAFPGAVMDDDKTWTAEQCGQGGMTLRDYFAAKAMSSVAHMDHDELEELTGEYGSMTTIQLIAYAAFHIADVMLKARAHSIPTAGKEG